MSANTTQRCEACRYAIWRDVQFRAGRRERLFGFLPAVPARVDATCGACGREASFVAGTIHVSNLMGNDWGITAIASGTSS